MGGVCSCSGAQPQYAQHIAALYPADLPALFSQEDVREWTLKGSPSDLISYVQGRPDKLSATAALIHRRIRNDIKRGRWRFAAIGALIMTALVDNVHSDERLSLYESSVFSSILLLFDSPLTELHALAAQCLCSVLKAQAENEGRIEGGKHSVGGGSARMRVAHVAPYSAYAAAIDSSKYSLFYPPLIRMATRNPPAEGMLAHIQQQAKEMIADARERDREKAARKKAKGKDHNNKKEDHDGGEREKGDGMKRVRDLAELEIEEDIEVSVARRSNLEPPALSPSHPDHPSSAPPNDDASASAPSSAHPSHHASQQHLPLKTRVSLYRSRYFGLKALWYLIRYNRDSSQNLKQLYALLPTILINMPKTRRSMEAVWNEACKLPYTRASVDESLNSVPVEEKDRERAASGVRLLHVQLAAYDCFVALCRLPGLSLHLPTMLHHLFHWMDQPHRTTVQTNIRGDVMHGHTTAAIGKKEKTEGGKAKKEKEKEAASPLPDPALSSIAPSSPCVGWEHLHFTTHLFSLLVRVALLDSGSMDVLLLSLLQHMQSMEAGLIGSHLAASGGGGQASAPASRRSSRAGNGSVTPSAADTSVHTPVAPSNAAPSTATATSTATPQPKTSLASDIRQLFKRSKSGSKSLLLHPHPRNVQRAILQLTCTILNQAASRRMEATKNAASMLGEMERVEEEEEEEGEGAEMESDDDDSVDTEVAGLSVASPAGLSVMNYQIVIDSIISHLVAVSLAREALVNALAEADQRDHGIVHDETGKHPSPDVSNAPLSAALSYTDDLLHLYSRVFPSLLVQCYYSSTDILHSLSLLTRRALACVSIASKGPKRVLLDACYNMSLGLMLWGGIRRSSSSSINNKQRLQIPDERDNEAASRGIILSGGGMVDTFVTDARGGIGTSFSAFPLEADTNLSIATLYETLMHRLLACIASEPQPSLRAICYRTLQCIVLCAQGFGGVGGLVGESGSGSNAGMGTGLQSWAMDVVTRATSISHPNQAMRQQSSNGGDMEVNNGQHDDNAAKDESAAAGLTLDVNQDDKNNPMSSSASAPSSSDVGDSTPSPRTIGSNGETASTSSPYSSTPNSARDLRQVRVPQVLASSLDIKSGLGSSTHGATPAAARFAAPWPSSAFTGRACVPLPAQEHRWLLSMMYYEITACLSSADDLPQLRAADQARQQQQQQPSPPVAPPNAFQLVSSIIKARGRGQTTRQNISLCFQLLLLLLQRRGAAVSQSTMRGEEDGVRTAAAYVDADELPIHQLLSLQLPLIMHLLQYIRSPTDDERFHLSPSGVSNLCSFIFGYLSFLSKLLLSQVDVQALRQTCLTLDDWLAANTPNKDNAAAQQQMETAWLFDMKEEAQAQQEGKDRKSQGDASSSSSSLDKNGCNVSSMDIEQLAIILARILHECQSSMNGPSTSMTPAPSSSPAVSNLQDPSLSDRLDASLAHHKSFLLDSASFEPFGLRFLLTEKEWAAAAEATNMNEDECEESVSWAPSNMIERDSSSTATAADAQAINMQIDAAASTPRLQALSMDARQKLGDGFTLHQSSNSNLSSTSQPDHPLSSPATNAASTVTPATGTPQLASNAAQASPADILVEMQKYALNGAAAAKSEEEVDALRAASFATFMNELSTLTHTHAHQPLALPYLQKHQHQHNYPHPYMNGHSQPTEASSKADVSSLHAPRPTSAQNASLLNGISHANANTSPVSPSTSPQAHANMAGAGDSDGSGLPCVEIVAASHPALNIMRPLSSSTLDLHFPKLASFDLYLHSEVE